MIPTWALTVYSMELRKQLVSRVEVINNILGHGLAYFTVAYFFWTAMYQLSGKPEMAGMTLMKMLLYQTMIPFIEKIVRGLDWPEVADEIYNGSLSRYILYPIGFLSYKLAQRIARTTYGLLQGVIAVSIFLLIFGVPQSVNFSITSMALFLVTVILIGLLDFALSTLIQLAAFWADNVWSLHVMYRFTCVFLGGGYLPLGLFPESVQNFLHYLPFWYLVEFPLRTLMGDYDLTLWAKALPLLILWILVGFLLVKIIWKRGQLVYTGVGL